MPELHFIKNRPQYLENLLQGEGAGIGVVGVRRTEVSANLKVSKKIAKISYVRCPLVAHVDLTPISDY